MPRPSRWRCPGPRRRLRRGGPHELAEAKMNLSDAHERLAGRRVLVTGGAGFIGGRLVERLVREAKADVRVLVRSFAGAARLARFPLDFARGDVLDRESLAA